MSLTKDHTAVLAALFAVLNALAALLLRVYGSMMYPFFMIVYVWIALYIVFIALLLRRWRLSGQQVLNNKIGIITVVVSTLALRLLFLGMSHPISLDSTWYLDFGKFMKSGLPPYTGFYFPYPPLFAYVILAVTYTVPIVDSFRILATCLDCVIALSLWKIAHRRGEPGWGPVAALAYAFLPISVIESGWNGHFEPLANVLLLVTVWFVLQHRPRVSGLLLGLAAATKVYPLLLFPVMFFCFKGWRNRIEFAVTTVVTGIATFLPFALVTLLGSGDGPPDQGGSTNPLAVLASSLFSVSTQAILTTVVAIIGITAATVAMVWLLLKPDTRRNRLVWIWLSAAVGVVLVIMGFVALYYPLSPMSKMVFWRYPPDIGVVRGFGGGLVGLIILGGAYRSYKSKAPQPTSLFSPIMLVCGTILLFASLSRDVFYGWYFLWSLPFFLLLRDRRIGLLVVLSLLLLYPSYTHDNFASLGFDEQRLWSEEFDSSEGWSIYVNVSDTGIDPSLVVANVSSAGGIGRFEFNTTLVQDLAVLRNITIQYTKQVAVSFDYFTEFTARVSSSWDPTFGAHALFEAVYSGENSSAMPINGTLVPSTTLFTNLTFVLWRYSLGYWQADPAGGTLHNVTVRVHPQVSGYSAYFIDYMYTTNTGLLNPVYFLVVPVLIALSLFSYTILSMELKHHEKTERHSLSPGGDPCSEGVSEEQTTERGNNGSARS